MNPRLSELADFYLARDDGESNLFEIWERGEGRGDSITPSTYSRAYREWMCGKLVRVMRDEGVTRLLSLGSGNAAVECELVSRGFRVLAVDALQEAVDIARSKGVEAVRGDVTDWAPDASWPVVYLDGLAGHLHDDVDGLVPSLKRLNSWFDDTDHPSGTVVISNDSTQNGEEVQHAPGVTGFRWLSGEYLRDQLLASGFSEVTVESLGYERPLSGERVRAVVTATVRLSAP